jgi:hypothetical protein
MASIDEEKKDEASALEKGQVPVEKSEINSFLNIG